MNNQGDNVHLKKKVTLRSKTAETPLEKAEKPYVSLKKKQPDPTEPTPSPRKNGGGKAKWYVAALAGLLVLGGGGYYLSQQGDEGDAPVLAVDDSPKSVGTTGGEATDENQGEQNPTDANEEVVDNASVEVAEGGTPAQPGPNQGNASSANDNATTSPTTDVPERSNPSTAGTVSQTTPTSSVNVTGTVEEEAIEVIRGKYGNGAVRKRNLGDRYAEIQSKVNEMYRNGQVH